MGLIVRFFQILWWIFMLGALWSMIKGLYRLWKAYGGYYTEGRQRSGRTSWGRAGEQSGSQEDVSAPGPAGQRKAERETVPCARCGVFVEKQSAIKKVVDGREVYYCSERCRG